MTTHIPIPMLDLVRLQFEVAAGRALGFGQGDVDSEGAPVATKRKQPQQKHKEERTSPAQFMREVRGELRKVVWESRVFVAILAGVVATDRADRRAAMIAAR